MQHAEDTISGNGQSSALKSSKPSKAQLRYLAYGSSQAGGKLPLFDDQGQEINPKTIRACVEKGWAEPWFSNPAKPDWLVCKLTESGHEMLKRYFFN